MCVYVCNIFWMSCCVALVEKWFNEVLGFGLVLLSTLVVLLGILLPKCGCSSRCLWERGRPAQRRCKQNETEDERGSKIYWDLLDSKSQEIEIKLREIRWRYCLENFFSPYFQVICKCRDSYNNNFSLAWCCFLFLDYFLSFRVCSWMGWLSVFPCCDFLPS